MVAPLLEENGYIIDEQTATLPDGADPPQLFYYWTGSRNKPYTGLRKYSTKSDFKPVSGRITLASPIGRGVLHNVECADVGTIMVQSAPKCEVALYAVTVSEKGQQAKAYYTFAGKATNGEILSDEVCHKLMELPVLNFNEDGRRAPSWLKSSTGRSRLHELDMLVDINSFKERALMDISETRREEIACIQDRTYHKKQELNRNISVLKNQLLQIENALSRTSAVSERIDAEKKKAAANKDLKKREQTLFLDSIRLDADAEGAVKALTEQANLTVTVNRQFVIQIIGGTTNG